MISVPMNHNASLQSIVTRNGSEHTEELDVHADRVSTANHANMSVGLVDEYQDAR